VNFAPRQRLYVGVATLVFVVHLIAAAIARPSFALTMYGDTTPCVLLILAILAARENFKRCSGILPVFWRLFAVGFAVLLSSQTYWCYYDWRRQNFAPSPITGDTLFLLGHVFFLCALALRPHSETAGRGLRIRFLDLVLLSVWWLSLYGYFSLPWQIGRQDFSQYTPSYYILALVQHCVILLALVILCARNPGPWRNFYAQMLVAFASLAAGNLLLNIAIDANTYYAGSFYDTPFLFGLFLFTPVAAYGPVLQPKPDGRLNRELFQSVWTARLAMLGTSSLPIIAMVGLYEHDIPSDVATFRLRLVFAAMLILGVLVYWKFNLLALELRQSVRLTSDSIENLEAVQQRITQSEKLVALGRLAAGAAHEISNPLTAIFGYSELLLEIPALSNDDRANALQIQEQVHRAQAAVSSLRNTLRQNSQPGADRVDKGANS